MTTYTLRTDGAEDTIEAATLAEARAAARDWIREGDYDTSDGTVWVDVRLYAAEEACEHRRMDNPTVAIRCLDCGAECSCGDEDGDDTDPDCELHGDVEPELVIVDTITVAIEQNAPACAGDDHDWQSPLWLVGGIKENPGVWGHGGGVIVHEACLRCGCRRITDTWAQRSDTGEQGLREVTYEPRYYDVPDWDREIDEDDIATAKDAGACASAIEWLRAQVRTVGELHDHEPAWYEWAMRRVWQQQTRMAA